MQIEVHEESLVLVEVFAELPDCETRRLLFGIWIVVVPVEVLVESIHPTVSIRHSIRVKHRDKDKNKIFAEKVGPHILFVS